MKRKAGFTLMEIMIVTLIISLLSAVAIPNVVRHMNRSRAQVCKGNMQMIFYAVEQYALDYNLSDGSSVSMANLVSGGYLDSLPTCPTNETYYADPQTVGVVPVCPDNISGHSWVP